MLIQKIINKILDKLHYEIRDGKTEIHSPLRALVSVQCFKGGFLHIGKDCTVNSFTYIGARKSVIIEDKVMIAPHCYISDSQHDYTYKGKERMLNDTSRETKIKKGAWIGHSCTIIGSEIGENCVIGAQSVIINKTIEDNMMYVGDSRLNGKRVRLPVLNKN